MAARLPLFGLGLLACTPPLPRPEPHDVRAATARWPDANAAELERGYSVYVRRCGACHQPYSPTDHAPADWPELVDAMVERAHVSPAETQALTRYVVAVSDRPKTPDSGARP